MERQYNQFIWQIQGNIYQNHIGKQNKLPNNLPDDFKFTLPTKNYQGKIIYDQSEYTNQKLSPSNPAFYINSPYQMILSVPVPQLFINPFCQKAIKSLTPNLSRTYDDAIKQSALYQNYETNILSKVVILYAQMLYNQIQTYKNALDIIYDAIDLLQEDKQQYIQLTKDTFSKMKDYIYIDLDPKQDVLLDDDTCTFIKQEQSKYYATTFTNIYSQKFMDNKTKRNYIKVVLPNKTCMFIQPPGRTLPTYDSVILLAEYLEKYQLKQYDESELPDETQSQCDEVQIQENVLADRDEPGYCSVCDLDFQSYNEHISSQLHKQQYNLALQYKVGKEIKAVSCRRYLNTNIPQTNQKSYKINQDDILRQMLLNTQLLNYKQLQIDSKCIEKYKSISQYQSFIQEVQEQQSQQIESECEQLLKDNKTIDLLSDTFSDILINKQQQIINKQFQTDDTCFVYIQQQSIEKIKKYNNIQLNHLIQFVISIQNQINNDQKPQKVIFINVKELEKELQDYQLDDKYKSNINKIGLFILSCLKQLNIKIEQNNNYSPKILVPDKILKIQEGSKLQQFYNNLQTQDIKFTLQKYKYNQLSILDTYQGRIENTNNIISLQAQNIILNSLYAGIQCQNSQSKLDFVEASQYYLQENCSNQLNMLPFETIKYYFNQ